MLYVSNNGETCKDQLCQHPECWQTNVRRVRQAVRRRNGIIDKVGQVGNEPGRWRLKQKKKLSSIPQNEILSLPTLKVIDITRNIKTPFDNGSDDDDSDQVFVEEERSPSYSTLHLSPIRNKRHISFGTYAPHTTPVSPSIPENKRQSRWREKMSCSESDDEKAKKISFHEIYDYEEVYQDWQETFISTAYLVWCPSKKKKEKRRSRASSASAITDFKMRGYKDIVEHALPLPVEETPKKRRQVKYPTGGQPYTPCRSPVTKYEHFKSVDVSDGDFIQTVPKEKIPQSLITSKKIIEHKTRSATKDIPHLQVRKSDSNKVLVDISSQLSLPTENQPPNFEETREVKNPLDNDDLVKRIEPERPKTAGTSQKQLLDFEPRKVLPLPSVGIPWGLIPVERRDHCKNSIPHGVDLGVVMEPVIYKARSASARGSKKKTCANVDPSTANTLKKEGELRNLTENSDERNHLTSAYRFSPRRLVAPAPTPMTPSTRDGTRRQLSDLIRSNATRSLSKTALPEQSCPKTRCENGSEGTEETSSRHAPGAQRSRLLDDHVIVEVEETNRNTLPEIVAEFSEISVDGRDEDRARTRNIDESAVKVNDSDSAISLRAVSPSSRTNIPPDIWAELRGMDFDDRRITPGKHLELRHHERVHSTIVARGFHSSLGLSVYSYTESSWKPAKLPQSFIGLRTCQGPYQQTILPRMPASLTVVPVPYVTRSSKSITNEPRRYHLAQSSSIRMPPVPVASPVLEIEITLPVAENKQSSQTTVDSKKSSEFRVISERIGHEHEYNDEHVPGEVEYLIARDVISHRDVSENAGENDEEQEVGAEMRVTEGDLKDCRWEIDGTREQEITHGESASVSLGEISEAFPKEAEHGCELSASDKRTLQENRPLDGTTIDQVAVEHTQEHGIAVDRYSSISNVADRPQSRTDTKSQDSNPEISGSSHHETQVSQVDDLSIDWARNDTEIATGDLMNEDVVPRDNFAEHVLPVISHESLASKDSGDFELEPFNVESELLRPIHIDSDLLLLSGDSYLGLGLSFDEFELDNFDDTLDGVVSPHNEVEPEP